MESKIIIVDYKVGNINSVSNALKQLGYNVLITNDEHEITSADAIILPGVGAFEEAMNNIRSLNLIPILENFALIEKKPVLGICIGMQILANYSEENGIHNGLGWIPGSVKKIHYNDNLLVPHVGWNNVNSKINKNIFFSNNELENPNFYWDHSYYFECDEKYKIATVDYGNEMSAIVGNENIFGAQFHPEKSQTNGLKLFRSFFNHFNLK
jgi:glutamine amidotransferase|tara:strand:- start:9618 stop:10250 length:633 start_codon:yes stop_codon:yes gene_type:complete